MASPGEKPTYTADKETVTLNGRTYPASVSVDVGGKSITARPENINGQIIWRHLGADFGIYLDMAQEAKLKQGINAAVGDLQHPHKPDAVPRHDPNIPSGPSGRHRRDLALQHSLADNVVTHSGHEPAKHHHNHPPHSHVKHHHGLRL